MFYSDLARQLARRGHSVTVVAPSCEVQAPTVDNVTVKRCPIASQALLVPDLLHQRAHFTRFAAQVARELQPDLIETHDWSGPLTSPPARPFVVRLHGTHTIARQQMGRRPQWPIRRLEQRLLASADAVIAASSWIACKTSKIFRIHQPITVVPNGIDTKLFQPTGTRSEPRQLLFVGTVKPAKGLLELFQVLPRVLASCPDLNVKIVGPLQHGADLKLRASLPERFRSRIEFTGPLQRHLLPALYSAATVCVLPSLAEAFGLTMAEAMSCGVPVVGSSLGAGPELGRQDHEVLLTDPRDPDAFAEAILRCLDDADLRARLSAAAREKVQRSFSWDVVVEQNERFYEQVLRRSNVWPKSA